jgi:hypothetical protein
VHHEAGAETVSEQQPPVEHWQGRINVPRPPQKLRPPRRFYLILAAAFLGGLLALGALSLGAELGQRPNLFSWGVIIIVLACLLLAARFAMPHPIGPLGALESSGYGEQPLPLLTAALAIVAFGLPSLVALVVLIVVGLRAG